MSKWNTELKEHYLIPFGFSILFYGMGIFLYYKTLISNELFYFDTFIHTGTSFSIIQLVLLRFLIPYFTEKNLLYYINKIYLLFFLIFFLNFYMILPIFNHPQDKSFHLSTELFSHLLWLVPLIGWIITHNFNQIKKE